MIGAGDLRSVLLYDPQTGTFSWLKPDARCVKRGDIAGSTLKGYVRIKVHRERHLAHRLAWLYMTGAWPLMQIDHINGNRSDNRWANLRLASQKQNSANQKRSKNNTSGFKGVSASKGLWRARLTLNGRRIALGYYTTPQDAHRAYVAAAERVWGEFARAA